MLAYVSASEVRVEDSETGRVVWRANRGNAEPATHLEWSVDGRRLLVLARESLQVFAAGGRLVGDEASERSPNVAAAFARDSAGVVVARRRGSESVVAELATGRLLFNGTGTFDGMKFSPYGRWLVISWPTADQWVFVGVAGPRRIRAVAGIAEQFRGRARIEGWCCRG